MTVFRRTLILGLLLGMLMLAGCAGAKTEAARKRESSHLRSLVSVYNFAAAKLGHRPANQAEFKSFIAANARPMLDSQHVNSVDELFISERDGQPFVVLYGEPTKGAAADLVAYEQVGVAGKRLAGYSLGAIAEIDEQQLANLAPAVNKPGK